MKLVMLTHEYPYPANYGGHVYTSNIIENIIDAGHELIILSAEPEGEIADPRYHDRFRFFARRNGVRWRYLTTDLPYMVLRYHTPDAIAQLERVLAELDGEVHAVFVDYLGLGWMYGEIRRIFGSLNKPVPELIYISHNVETDVRDRVAKGFRGNSFVRKFLQFDAQRTRRLELSMLSESGLVTTITQEDADRFAMFDVPTEYYVLSPGYKGEIASYDHLPSDLPRAVILIGNRLTVMKKIVLDEFLEHNYLPQCESDITVHVTGPMKGDDLDRYRSTFPRFDFHGFVDDLQPLLSRVRIGIIADKVGGGFKHRFLTYVFQRVPIMAPRDSIAGLPLVEGEDFIAFDDPHEIAGLLDQYMDDHAELDRLQRSAFRKCAEHFSYKTNVRAFLKWYEARLAAA